MALALLGSKPQNMRAIVNLTVSGAFVAARALSAGAVAALSARNLLGSKPNCMGALMGIPPRGGYLAFHASIHTAAGIPTAMFGANVKSLCSRIVRRSGNARNRVWDGPRYQSTPTSRELDHIVTDKPSRVHKTSTGKGKIDIIVGPMFSGKTTELLRRLNEAKDVGRRVLCIKSGKDDRYSTDEAVTHDGIRMPCIAIDRLEALLADLQSGAFKDVDMVGIDEAQFFEDLEAFCAAAADKLGKTVVVAGLDGDFRRRPFGKVLSLVPKSDSVTKLRAVCKYCTADALFTVRVVAETSTELIGGGEAYVPVCRAHYLDEEINIHG